MSSYQKTEKKKNERKQQNKIRLANAEYLNPQQEFKYIYSKVYELTAVSKLWLSRVTISGLNYREDRHSSHFVNFSSTGSDLLLIKLKNRKDDFTYRSDNTTEHRLDVLFVTVLLTD